MRSRILFITLLAFLSAGASYGGDGEVFCRASIEENTVRAQWGLDLRSEMLIKCKGKNIAQCSRPYSAAIDKQRLDDQVKLVEFFNRKNPSESDKYYFQGASFQLTSAALRGFRGAGSSAKEIAYKMYTECVEDSYTASSIASSSRRAPGAPSGSEPPITSACTNYTVMGQNGQTQYCQKCCYGGNCQVYCN